ncbi:hypothetical protein [Chromatium okenii]|nr:hypothetical protein [Chromatium okenii]
MFTFKVKYKKSGETVEVDIEVSVPALDAALAATRLGVQPSQIISIKKK